ncbi:DNA mismatch repair protein MutS [Xylanibacter rodentium]|uniref:DNA mismatch repair protein MutS n=1 Tax=Xylanibacter rodentium TaxID=2736289 RepID=UPI00258C93F6|nr:DNA mismatch repair protein MutS [Xylanibacter rodentium]
MAKKKEETEGSTLMKQFEEMKKKYPDAILLFRAGNYYETYREDAIKAKQILGLDTESRVYGGVKTNVASFQHDALDTYLPKLVRAGMRVAICEQLEDPKIKKQEKEAVKETAAKTDETQLTNTTMPRKKKEQAPEQEQPKAKAETKNEVKPETKAEAKTEQKTEAKAELKTEAQQERKPREPQMVTVNGDKVTHGHSFQSKDNPENWYFTAKINGEQLKPQKMDPADLAAYQKKEMTVPQLMERYYPTKLMPKVPEVAFKTPNVLTGPEGNMTIDKFNVYKEKDETRADYGKYKFYAQIGDTKMSTVASRQDLNAYFDRVMTPGQLVEKNFGERLHLPSHYQQFKLPEGIEKDQIRIAKDRNDGKWKVSVDLGERGKTEKKDMSFDDGFSLYKTKTATREQIAAKYVGDEVKSLLATPAAKMEKSASMKV